MFAHLLALHSLLRWFIVFTLVASVFRAFQGWLSHKNYVKFDRYLNVLVLVFLYAQLGLGLILYYKSAYVDYFLNNFKKAIHMRDFRFFGMEHITAMCISIILITMGYMKMNQKKTDQGKFKTLAFWFTFGLVILWISIPWSFSPFTSRPDLRPFSI